MSIPQIVERAMIMGLIPIDYDTKRDIILDINVANMDVGIDLDKLLNFDDSNFTHDIVGIIKNVNRKTLKLDNCFCPRSVKTKV